MHRVNLGSTLLMLAAIATCGVLLRRKQKKLPLTASQKFGLGVGAFCGAMIGAKLPFVLSDWNGLACFRGGCCYGTPTTLPWGVVFPAAIDGPTLPRHPTQLYETAFHFVAGGVLIWLGRHGIFRRQLIKLYLLSYLVCRFLTEFVRPEQRIWFGITGYQAAALALIPLFLWLWWRDRKSVGDLAG